METLPNCTLRYKVSVEPQFVKELRAKAVKAVSKEVSIPGFRPGKAPEDLIEKQYGKFVEKEFREIATQNVVSEVIKLAKLYPLQREGGVSLDKFDADDNKVEITFSYDTFPTVPEVILDNIPFDAVAKEDVKEEEIEKTLKEIRLYHATWKEITDRPAQPSDFVVIDIDVIDEPAFKAYENSRFHIIEKGMPQWAQKIVIGLSRGESGEGMSEKEGEAEVDFVPRLCRITVNLIQEAELPEMTDELAQKAGVQTVEDLKKNIRLQLETEKKKSQVNSMRMQARDYLINNYNFDLPVTDIKNLEADCKKLLERDKANFKTEAEMKDYSEKLFENGKGVIRLAYLIPHLANQLSVPMPSEDEANSRMVEVLTQYYLKTQSQVPEDQFPSIFQKIQRDLLAEHTLDKLIEKNVAITA